MSTYQQRHQQLTDAHAAADRVHPDAGDSWRAARRSAALAVLLDAATHPDPDTAPATLSSALIADQVDRFDLRVQVIADLVDEQDPAHQRTLRWLAETGDTDTVAGVAALLDHARTSCL